MKVMVIGVDDHDRVKLSRRRAYEELGEPDPIVTTDAAPDREPRSDRDRDRDRGQYGDRPPRRRDDGQRSGGRGGRGGGGGGGRR